MVPVSSCMISLIVKIMKELHTNFFFNKIFEDFFFNFIDFLVIVPVVAEEKQGHIQNQH